MFCFSSFSARNGDVHKLSKTLGELVKIEMGELEMGCTSVQMRTESEMEMSTVHGSNVSKIIMFLLVVCVCVCAYASLSQSNESNENVHTD